MAKHDYTQEQLDHFLEHPEEVDATNTALVSALAAGAFANLGDIQGGKAKGIEEPEPIELDEDAKEAERAIEEAEAKVAAERAGEPAKAEEPEVKTEVTDGPIATKDGKHTLPFAVLKGERDARAGAEAALAEAQQSIVALADEVKALRAGKEPAKAEAESPTNKTVEELREALKEVEKEAPWNVPVHEKTIAALELLQQQIADLRGAREQDEQQVVASLQEQAAEAFDNNATLTLWKATHPELFEEAVKFDKFLRTDVEMREQYTDFGTRFSAAVEMVKARHAGQTLPLPEAINPSSKPAAPANKPSASEIQARAKEALDKASAEAVRTLSDISGGVGEVAAHEALARMDVGDVGGKFMKMTPQQILDWTMSH